MSKKSALAKHLSVDESEIVERDDNTFEVNPHTHLVGTSPDEARRLVEQLFKVLDASKGPWTLDTIRQTGYNNLQHDLRTHAPETLKIGIHEVLNTLYFLCPETDDEEHAVDHRDTLREAAQGLPIQDRRRPQPSRDGEYLVLTDREADEAWDEALDHYLDACVLSELPEIAQRYFNCDAWKRDARVDGRGVCLALHDGIETEVYDEEDDKTYYIYWTG